jgi:F0F1-type ATP synthase delta subunit
MIARYYAIAVLQFLADHPRTETATTIERLKKVLTRRGHSTLLPRIVSEMEKEMAKRERAQAVTVAVARERDRAQALTASALIAGERGIEQKHITTVVDPGLLGGFALRGPGFRYDKSQRATLLQLYKSLTA